MKQRKIKKITSFMLMFIIIIGFNTLSINSNAHNSDIHNGNVGYSVVGLRLGINPSALNSVLTLDVYNSANNTNAGGWSSTTSSRANVGSVVNLGANPNGARDVDVVGVALGNILGRVQPRDSLGNLLSMDANFWNSITIEMNNDANIWGNSTVPAATRTQRARHTYFHEIGHVFKLSHPAMGNTATAISGHNIHGTSTYGTGWYPSALMNQGFPGSPVSAVVVTHDTSNINAKW
jgi:hypothetical protein